MPVNKDNRALSASAFSEALVGLALASDMVTNAEYNKWRWVLVLTIAEAVIKSLWAIYFEIRFITDKVAIADVSQT